VTWTDSPKNTLLYRCGNNVTYPDENDVEVPGKSLPFLFHLEWREGCGACWSWVVDGKPPIATSPLLEPPSLMFQDESLPRRIAAHNAFAKDRMSHPQAQDIQMIPSLALERAIRCRASRHGAIVTTSECTPTPATAQLLPENTHGNWGFP
jgi:hypothetical protein